MTPHDKTQATTTERSARRAVNWATVVAVSLLWLLFAFWGHALHTNNRHATEQVLDIQRAAIAEQVNGVFRTTETFLAAANRWVADNPLRDPHTDPTFVQLVRDFQQVTNEAMLVRLVDADGTLHLVPSVSGAKPSKVADRDYFKAAMENPPGSISISAPFQGRSTGRWAIAVATRLTAPSHGLAVVFVAIDMTLIDDSFNKSRLQNGGSISLVRRDGVLLARSAAQRGELGIDMSRSVLFTEGLQNADEGVLFTEAKQTDKVPKLIAYGVVANYPLVVTAGMNMEKVLADTSFTILRVGAILVLASLMLVLGRWKFVAMLDDLASSRERLWFQATHDNLTGILSRGYFVERAEDAIRRALRYREPLSLINLDIDYFKLINDRFGHQSGDDTLKALTATCATCLREVDLFGRLGGEEFCILLPQTDTDGAMHVAERIRESVASQSSDHGNEHLKITVSLGVAAFFESDRNFDPLYARADRALYRAKQNGRNRVELDISEDSRGL